MQKYVNLVDLVKSYSNRYEYLLAKSASIQPRTSPSKFGGKFNSLFICLLTHDCSALRRIYQACCATVLCVKTKRQFDILISQIVDFTSYVWAQETYILCEVDKRSLLDCQKSSSYECCRTLCPGDVLEARAEQLWFPSWRSRLCEGRARAFGR